MYTGINLSQNPYINTNQDLPLALPFEEDLPPEDERPPELDEPDLPDVLVVRVPEDLLAVRPEVLLGDDAAFGPPPFLSLDALLFSERLFPETASSSSC